MYQKIKNNHYQLTDSSGNSCIKIILNVGINENYDIHLSGPDDFDTKDYLLTLQMFQQMNPGLTYLINFEFKNEVTSILNEVASNDSLRQKFIFNFVEFMRNYNLKGVLFSNYSKINDNILQMIKTNLQMALREIDTIDDKGEFLSNFFS